jgi:hypothetical protein
MLTQHKVQLDLREKNPNLVRPPANPYVVGGQQQLKAVSSAAVCPDCTFLGHVPHGNPCRSVPVASCPMTIA